MKKYTLVLFVFILAFICYGFLGFNVNSASAANCAPGELFNTTTGQACGTATVVVQCSAGDLFSSATGQRCTAWTSVSCPIWLTQELRIGMRGENVRAFQQMLMSAGFSSGKIDGIYGPITDSASISYYRRCPKPFPNPNTPVISGVSGPQSLKVYEQGTWTVTASSRNGGNLSYSVNWNDNNMGMTSAFESSLAQQSATFTHSYSQAGIYTPTFTVTSANTINCITIPCPSNADSAQASLSVNVGGIEVGAGSLYISPSNISLNVGGSADVKAYYQPPFSCPPTNPASACAQVMPAPVEVNASVVWSVGNENIARLTYSIPGCYPGTVCGGMGVIVTGVSAGTTELTAKYTISGQTLRATAGVVIN